MSADLIQEQMTLFLNPEWPSDKQIMAQVMHRVGMRTQECEGHPAGPFDPMGETVYCDGTCQ